MLNVVVDVVEADQAQRLTDVFHVNGPKEGWGIKCAIQKSTLLF